LLLLILCTLANFLSETACVCAPDVPAEKITFDWPTPPAAGMVVSVIDWLASIQKPPLM
jgi:hypothetical protein